MYSFSNIKKSCWIGFWAIIAFSCANFFKPVRQDTSTTEATKGTIVTNLDNRYFILRQGDYSYGLTDISVDNVSLTLNAKLVPVDPGHLLYVTAKGKDYRYTPNRNSGSNVLKEVHIYSKQTGALDRSKPFSLSLDQIEKIEVIEHDKARTATSYILGGVGITLGAIAVAGIIVALTKSSCPFVSIYDGKQYIVEGELFGGAVNKNLERSDYLPLTIKPVNETYQLRISNELKERQFTNFANLLVVEHNNSAKIGVGTDGRIYQLGNCLSPYSAILNNTADVLKQINQADGVTCNFNDTLNSSPTNEIMLEFKSTGSINNAKLVLQLKNSYWFDYLYGEFISHFGSTYNKWHEEQNNQPAAQMIHWTDSQEIPLTVSVNDNDGWKEVCKINTVGPLTNRQVIIPLVNTNSNQSIQIKLSTGFMFWELDYAAVDFSEEQQLAIQTLQPFSAIDEKGNEMLNVLKDKDDQYLTQLEAGNYVTLKYKMGKPVDPEKSYSVVLATSGYYEPVREYSGAPDFAFLKKFKEPGAMAAFSKDRYLSIARNQKIIALKQN